jgi:hypothetical protein
MLRRQRSVQATQIPGVTDTPRLKVWTDYGELGEGASKAHSVLAENGEEYIAKGPVFNPALPYVAANELIVARLAEWLGLPLLDFRVLEMKGDLFFGSAWMAKPTFYPAITKTLFDQCENRARNYDIVAFDWWVYNTDRHEHNLMVRKGGRTPSGPRHLLMLNDHSHALIQAGESPATNTKNVRIAPAVRLDFLRDSIRSTTKFGYAIDLIENIPDGTIRSVVGSVPEPFLAADERSAVVEFLCNRRDDLRPMFNRERILLPKLQGGQI